MLGPVFRAYDPGQDKLVAVKLFRLDLPPERAHELVADFDRLIAADLTHSSIVAAIATGIVQVSPYLAQDFVAADSLDTVLREHGPAPAGEALRIVTQIAGGLDYAAVVGIVHGGLHPRDVLISPDDVRLTGLGVARALERVSAQCPVRRPYAAPERVDGGAWDRRADVFTLATLAHELLWGRRLTATGAEAAAALDALPGAAANRLRDTFARALAENPAHRFPTALEFADALKSCFADRPEARPFPAQATGYRQRPVEESLAAVPLLPLVADETTVAVKDETTVTVKLDDGPPDLEPRIESNPAGPAGDPFPELALRSADRGPVDEDETAPSIPLAAIPVEPLAEAAGPVHEPAAPQADQADTVRVDQPPGVEVEVHAEAPVRAAVPVPPVRLEHPITLGSAEPLDPARSAVWPLSLALVVGVALGFAGGYWLGQSEQRRAQTEAVGGSTAAETEVRLKAESNATRPGAAPVAGADVTAPAAPPPSAAPAAAPAPAAPPRAAETAPAVANAGPPGLPNEGSKPADAAPVARTGRITVRTTPSGARVTIDGRDVGRAPLTIPNLSRGTHTVRVSRDGYSAVERRVVISTTQPTSTLTLNLARASAPAARPAEDEPAVRQTVSVVFESRPSGAAVFLDGKRVGTTPMALPAVSTGSHAVRFEMDGHRSWSGSVSIVAGEKNRVAASLEQQ